jgi:hypothetical protein
VLKDVDAKDNNVITQVIRENSPTLPRINYG